MDLIFVAEDAARVRDFPAAASLAGLPENSGGVSLTSITTPTIARLRNGTATRQPGATTSCNSAGTA